MRRLHSGWRPIVSSAVAEQARDCVARAQAALLDEHDSGALRQILCLHDLLVPPLDAWVRSQAAKSGQDDGQAVAMSAALGLFGLWNELPDIDVERESIEELLVFHAAHVDSSFFPDGQGTALVPEQLEAALRKLPRPRSRFWRRLARRASGSLGDRGYITVQRGSTVVLERPPALSGSEPAAAESGNEESSDYCSDLGELRAGDRLTLRFAMPLPGQLAVLHAAGDGYEAELALLLPQSVSEAVVRRHQEIVEVAGEIFAVPHCPEHGLCVLWGPELLPPSWGREVVLRRQVPPQARVFLYRYTVPPPADAS